MSNEQNDLLLGMLKVLADESRLKILGLLTQREHSVKELSDLVGLKEPTVSHHLAKLGEYDLVSMRADRNTHYYKLKLSELRSFRKDLFSKEHVSGLVDDVNADVFERKVFRTYVDDDGKITQLPMMQKKRHVLLRWLGAFFEEGIEYGHKEVNAIIKDHHSDTATLRREMIGIGVLKRERDSYWKMPA